MAIRETDDGIDLGLSGETSGKLNFSLGSGQASTTAGLIVLAALLVLVGLRQSLPTPG